MSLCHEYVGTCAIHANLNHHLDCFIYENQDLRESVKKEIEEVAKKLRPKGIKVGQVSADGGVSLAEKEWAEVQSNKTLFELKQNNKKT